MPAPACTQPTDCLDQPWSIASHGAIHNVEELRTKFGEPQP
jgi:hypothetical protein